MFYVWEEWLYLLTSTMESFEGFLPVLFGINSTGKVKDCYLCLFSYCPAPNHHFVSFMQSTEHVYWDYVWISPENYRIVYHAFFFCDYEQIQAAFDYSLSFRWRHTNQGNCITVAVFQCFFHPLLKKLNRFPQPKHAIIFCLVLWNIHI